MYPIQHRHAADAALSQCWARADVVLTVVLTPAGLFWPMLTYTQVRAPHPYSMPCAIAEHVLLVGNLRHFPNPRQTGPDADANTRAATDTLAATDTRTGTTNGGAVGAWPADCAACGTGLVKRVTPAVLAQAYVRQALATLMQRRSSARLD